MQNYYLPPAASTPWRPSFSPDGEWIVFSMAGSIWKIRIGETTAYELTAGSTYDSSPVFSRRLSKIVYTADEGYKAINLRMLDLKTGESHALTEGSQVNSGSGVRAGRQAPALCLDGPRRLVQPYAMPLDAAGNPGAAVQLTADHSYHNARLYFGARRPTHPADHCARRRRDDSRFQPRHLARFAWVWRAPIEPNAMEKAKLILQEETLYRTRPQWSPDGKRVSFTAPTADAVRQPLSVLPVGGGGEPYQLTFGEWDHFEPRWSPDGEWIVYVANEHGLSELRLLETFGGEERPIEIHQRVYKRPMGTLAVTVRDGRTGPLTSAKIMLTAADGKAYAPPTPTTVSARGRFSRLLPHGRDLRSGPACR
ncbi:MAG: hypothetical protein R2748_02220 [Bryobacterales bacterium]